MRNMAIGWWQAIMSHKENTVYRKTSDNGVESIEYGEWSKNLQRLSVGLMEQDFEPNTRVGFVAQNCMAWTDLALATWFAGGTVVPIMPGKDRRQTLRALARSGCDWIVVRDLDGLDTLRGQADDLPGHLKWIVLQDGNIPAHPHIYTVPKLIESGRYRLLRGGEKQLGQRMYEQPLDHPALILFDANGYDDPHGAYFTGKQVVSQIEALGRDAMWENASLGVIASYSMTESIILTLAALWAGQTLVTGDTLGDVVGALHELAPTHLLVHDGYLKGRATQWRKKLESAPEFLKKIADTQQEDKSSFVKLVSGLSERAAQNALFDHVRNDLGDALTTIYIINGTTPDEVDDMLTMIQVEVLGLFGLPECGISHIERPGAARPHGVGRPVEGYACKLDQTKGDEPGQILIKSDHLFKGYWDDEGPRHIDEAGWLHTGIEGQLESGNLTLRTEADHS